MNDEAVRNLVSAIVMQAVKDYKAALYNYNTKRKREEKQAAAYRVRECEIFFRKNLGIYCDLDGEQIIRKLRHDVRKKLREKKGINMEVPNDSRRII